MEETCGGLSQTTRRRDGDIVGHEYEVSSMVRNRRKGVDLTFIDSQCGIVSIERHRVRNRILRITN